VRLVLTRSEKEPPMKFAPMCLILPTLALAACNSANHEQERAAAAAAIAQQQAEAAAAAAAAAAPAAATPQMTVDHLVSFDIVTGSGATLAGYRKTGASSWEGPHPDTGQTVQWSAAAGSGQLVFVTEHPPTRTMTIRTMKILADGSVVSGGLPSGSSISRAVYQ
jgi:hypothetical protein